MKAIFHKLRARTGETLIESLAAILIFTMASLVMYSMVTAAADINATAKEKDAQVQTQMAVAEKGEGTPASGKITMTITASGNGETIEVAGGDVVIYGTPGSTLYAYYEKEAAE